LTLSGRNVTFWKGPISLSGSTKTLAKHAPASPQWWPCAPSRISWGLRAYRQPRTPCKPPPPSHAASCPGLSHVGLSTNHPSTHPAIQPSNIPTVPVLETSCSCPKYTRNNMANFISISPPKIGQLQAFKGPFQVYSEIKCNQSYSSVVASCDPWIMSLPAGYRWKNLEVNHQFSDKSKCQ
jgi:hypothetical protein